jgi:hypothetical protein
VNKSRAQFRAENGISEDKYLIYIDAGINKKEAKFSFRSFKNGLNEFFAKDEIKNIDKDHFEIFVHVPNSVPLVLIRVPEKKSRANSVTSHRMSKLQPLKAKTNTLFSLPLILGCCIMEKQQ